MTRPLLTAIVPEEPRAADAARARSYSEQKVIGNCRLLEQRGRRPASAPWSFAAQRLSEIEAFLRARFGAAGVDTDDAAMLFLIAANHIVLHERAIASRVPDRPPAAEVCRAWGRRWTPGASTDEVERAIALAVAKPRRYKADTLARLLGVTSAERKLLGLRTTGATDCNAVGRKAVRKADNAKRMAAQRAARPGHLSRTDYIARSDAELARTLGVCRTTIHRRKKAGTLEALIEERGLQQVCAPYKNRPSNSAHTRVARLKRPDKASPIPKPIMADLARIGAQARAATARMQHAAAPLRIAAIQFHKALNAPNHGGPDAE